MRRLGRRAFIITRSRRFVADIQHVVRIGRQMAPKRLVLSIRQRIGFADFLQRLNSKFRKSPSSEGRSKEFF